MLVTVWYRMEYPADAYYSMVPYGVGKKAKVPTPNTNEALKTTPKPQAWPSRSKPFICPSTKYSTYNTVRGRTT
jgi:hypothetical protein